MKIADRLSKLVATFFYVGYLPFVPGTFGSIAGLALYFFLKGNNFLYLSAVLVIMLIGFVTCGRAEKIIGKKDPKYVVIDEVAGMLISLMFLPYELKWVISGFFVFRLLDTLKPFPANRFQKLHGSIGIMGDDIVAGLYCNIVLQIALRLVSCKGS
jgi:phosphatidylglycerophosphatase A